MIKAENEEYLAEVIKFAIDSGLEDNLNEQLEFLSTYANREGCSYDRNTGANTRCKLYKDFAPYSFQFVMEKKEKDTDYKFWFNGGLIYSGPSQPLDGSFPALTVSIGKPKTGWSIHT